jgi:hypothetical protein
VRRSLYIVQAALLVIAPAGVFASPPGMGGSLLSRPSCGSCSTQADGFRQMTSSGHWDASGAAPRAQYWKPTPAQGANPSPPSASGSMDASRAAPSEGRLERGVAWTAPETYRTPARVPRVAHSETSRLWASPVHGGRVHNDPWSNHPGWQRQTHASQLSEIVPDHGCGCHHPVVSPPRSRIFQHLFGAVSEEEESDCDCGELPVVELQCEPDCCDQCADVDPCDESLAERFRHLWPF